MNDLKSVVPRPPKKGSNVHRLEAPPAAELAVKSKLTPSTGWVDLNFKVTPDFHRKYRMLAAQWSMSMKDILEASLKAWEEKIGNEPPKDLFEK